MLDAALIWISRGGEQGGGSENEDLVLKRGRLPHVEAESDSAIGDLGGTGLCQKRNTHHRSGSSKRIEAW